MFICILSDKLHTLSYLVMYKNYYTTSFPVLKLKQSMRSGIYFLGTETVNIKTVLMVSLIIYLSTKNFFQCINQAN